VQRGSSQPNINGQMYSDYLIPTPSLAIQEQLVLEIEKLETQITADQTVINEASAKKQAILKRYL
ncbi:MAG: hypothetical protein ACRC6M_09690, partial [Microcystaceae cyanobacterium]